MACEHALLSHVRRTREGVLWSAGTIIQVAPFSEEDIAARTEQQARTAETSSAVLETSLAASIAQFPQPELSGEVV